MATDGGAPTADETALVTTPAQVEVVAQQPRRKRKRRPSEDPAYQKAIALGYANPERYQPPPDGGPGTGSGLYAAIDKTHIKSQPEPWERQPGEPAKMYIHFTAYRDLDPAKRSLAEAARQIGLAKETLGNYSARWNWVARAKAWDFEKDERARAKVASSALAARTNLISFAQGWMAKLAPKIATLDPNLIPDADIPRILNDLARVVQIAEGPAASSPAASSQAAAQAAAAVTITINNNTDEEYIAGLEAAARAVAQAKHAEQAT